MLVFIALSFGLVTINRSVIDLGKPILPLSLSEKMVSKFMVSVLKVKLTGELVNSTSFLQLDAKTNTKNK